MRADSTRVGRPSPLIKAKAHPTPPRASGLVERTTLFLIALKRGQAKELLDGLAQEPKARAEAFAKQLVQLDSATRQARIAREFGPDAAFDARVHELVVRSPPALRHAVYAQLPPSSRPAGFVSTSSSPALQALAARLVREMRFG